MNIKNDKGITLIILVVTIIVMIILSSLFIINTVNDGTIKRAENIVDLNNDLLNKTKDSEKDLLVQNVTTFKVQNQLKNIINNSIN